MAPKAETVVKFPIWECPGCQRLVIDPMAHVGPPPALVDARERYGLQDDICTACVMDAILEAHRGLAT